MRLIVTLGTPDAAVLRKRSRPVGSVGAAVRSLIADMVVTMRRAQGVGLAAPQVGVPLRVLVADPGTGPIALVNPRMRRRWGTQVGPEGCLSVPGVLHNIPRALGVEVEAFAATGRRILVRGTGLLARILQHEIDHLNGILFFDRLPKRRGARSRRGATGSRAAVPSRRAPARRRAREAAPARRRA